MRQSLILCFLVCGAALASAQTGDTPSGQRAAQASKVTPGETVEAPAAKPQAPAAAQPNAAPPAAGAPADNGLPPRKAGETKPSGDAQTDLGSVAKTKAYVIGPLDVLYVRVWNQPNLTGIVGVGPDGIMSMALIGQVKADGLTAAQLTDVIKKRLGECCLNDPEVSIEISKINSKSYIVVGGVTKPGKYPLTEKTTVLDAIVDAGGPRDFAKKSKIYVLRGTEKKPFNYNDVTKGKHPEENIELQNGDQVVVPE